MKVNFSVDEGAEIFLSFNVPFIFDTLRVMFFAPDLSVAPTTASLFAITAISETPSNALSPSLVTLLSIENLFRDVHPLNALLPISVTPRAITLLRFVQPAKAPSGIFVMYIGKTTVSISVFPANAFAASAVTFLDE